MRVPKYRKHSTRNVGFSEHASKRHYFPGHYDSPESRGAYQQFLCGIGADGSLNAGANRQLSVMRLVAMFMEWAAEEYGTGGDTRYDVYRAAAKHLLERHAWHDAAKFGPSHLRSIMEAMAQKKLRRSYIGEVKRHICFIFQWGLTEQLLPAEVLHALERVRGLRRGRTDAQEKKEGYNPTWKDIRAVFPEISRTARLMLRFQWLVFFRSKSICNATPEQFKIIEGDLWEWRPQHKTEYMDISVVLFIGPRCQRLLRLLLKHTKPGNRLFPDYKTRSYCKHIVRGQERLNRKREAADLPPIPHWTPHRLRHARGERVREQFGAEAAQAALAHETLTATQVYTRRSRSKARAVAEAIG